jgi:hypothetical protein
VLLRDLIRGNSPHRSAELDEARFRGGRVAKMRSALRARSATASAAIRKPLPLRTTMTQLAGPARRALASFAAPAPASPTLPPLVLSAPTSAARRTVSLLEIDATGSMRERRIAALSLKEESRLHARELLLVETAEPGAAPRILARRHAIAAVIGPARLIVFPSRVYILGVESLPGARA